MPVISALWRLKLEKSHAFQASLCYIVSLSPQIKGAICRHHLLWLERLLQTHVETVIVIKGWDSLLHLFECEYACVHVCVRASPENDLLESVLLVCGVLVIKLGV